MRMRAMFVQRRELCDSKLGTMTQNRQILNFPLSLPCRTFHLTAPPFIFSGALFIPRRVFTYRSPRLLSVRIHGPSLDPFVGY